MAGETKAPVKKTAAQKESVTTHRGLFKKLHEIQEKVNALAKNDKGYNYDYVNGDKVLAYIKPLMNEKGLLLIQETGKVENTLINYKNSRGVEKTEVLSSVQQFFTWVDIETSQERRCEFHANGMNEFEKGLGSALTYAERYFLLKFFHIQTDRDDVDNTDRKKETEPINKNSTQNGTSTDTSTENKPVTRTKEEICIEMDGCKTLVDLGKIWNKLSPVEKTTTEAHKNTVKEKLQKSQPQS